jgi:formyltetrahydrofolate deformylase
MNAQKPATNAFILTLSCPDKPGIVAAISHIMAQHELNIVESQQYGDAESGQFFMRIGFEGDVAQADCQALFDAAARAFNMQWQLTNAHHLPKALILLSKFDHCLVDLIYRQQVGSLNMEIAAIASNHEVGRRRADNAGLPYHLLGGKEEKSENEARLDALIEAKHIDLIVLARYMQILTPEFTARHAGRIINIHHSFLPSFKGAEPYSQAHRRGVKIIGATAHFVTEDLDEGPIIAQGVEAVRHDMGVSTLVDVGRDTERRTLARAVKLYTERRVFLNGDKTVVFD